MPQAKAKPSVYTNTSIVEAATGRWGEVANDIKFAEPYVITLPDDKTITIEPLTRRRRKKMKAAQAAYIMTGAQLADAQNAKDADAGVLARIEQTMEEAEKTYDEALFGDAFTEVYETFEDLPEEFWDTMYQDVHDKLVNRVELPEGICPKCGQEVKPEGATEGKDESSSTSSTTTGTS
jgi:hypothetical protein